MTTTAPTTPHPYTDEFAIEDVGQLTANNEGLILFVLSVLPSMGGGSPSAEEVDGAVLTTEAAVDIKNL